MIPAIGSSQNESALRRGNAMSAAPSISGTTKFASPANAGITNRKIISDAWTEKSPLNVCVSKNCMPGRASSARTRSASKPPTKKKKIVVDEVLDSDHLVIGVDAEVVLPRARAVAGVVLGPRRTADRVVGPVVERADAGEEAERRTHEQRHERDDRHVDDRMPAAPPAEDHDQAEAEGAEEAEHPGSTDPAGAEEQPASPASARRCNLVVGGDSGHVLGLTPSCSS